MAKRFLSAYAADPSALPALYGQLHLPEPLRSEIVGFAITQAIALKPDETLRGIENLPMRHLKVPLLVKAISEMSKSDPAEANRRALACGMPEAMAGAAIAYWKHSPDDAMKQFAACTREQQSAMLPAVVFSDIALDGSAAKGIHEVIRSLATQGDMAAAASEGAVLRKCLASDPDYVERYLDAQNSVAIRDQVAPDLALARSNNDWERANEWLSEYQNGETTPATHEFWRRWAERDANGLEAYLASSASDASRQGILGYFRGPGRGAAGSDAIIKRFDNSE